jgi:hypothetical protein
VKGDQEGKERKMSNDKPEIMIRFQIESGQIEGRGLAAFSIHFSRSLNNANHEERSAVLVGIKNPD